MGQRKFVLTVDSEEIDRLRVKLIRESRDHDDAMMFIGSTDAGIVLAAVDSDLLACDDIDELPREAVLCFNPVTCKKGGS
jgi:hypothetical protein